MKAKTTVDKNLFYIPGLPRTFNVYFDAIDRILPNSTRNEVGTVDILNKALGSRTAINEEIIKCVHGFVSACEHLRKQQFCLDKGKRYSDLENNWLSILLLGNEWYKAVRYLLDLELPTILSSAIAIRLKPITQKELPRLTITLIRQFHGIGEAEYKFFEQHIKTRFALTSTYNSAAKEISILNRNVCDVGKAVDAEGLLNGKVPLWIQRLLEWGVVEEVLIEYPIQKRGVDTASSVIGSLLAWPNCPVKWRAKNTSELDEAFKEAQNILEVGNGPYHIMLTECTEEWLPFLYHYASRIADEVRYLTGESLPDDKAPVSLAIGKDSASQEIGVTLLDFTLTRRLSLVPLKIERIESEYERPPFLISCIDNEGAEILTTKHTYRLEVSPSIGENILQRIGMVEYLDTVVAAFLAHGEKLQDAIKSIEQSDKKKLPPIELNGIQRPAIGSPAELCCATLALIGQHLMAVHELHNNVRVSWRQNTPWTWLFDFPIDPLPEQVAFQHLVKLLISCKEVTTRTKVLAGILYVLNPADAVEDSGPAGLCDDNFVMAKILRELPEKEVPEQLLTWAVSVCGNADGCMESSLQENVMNMLNNYEKQLCKPLNSN